MDIPEYYSEAYELAKKYDAALMAHRPDYPYHVRVVLDDGSVFHWDSATVRQLGKWRFVFTEHHGFHVYDEDDVYSLHTFRVVYEVFEELKLP